MIIPGAINALLGIPVDKPWRDEFDLSAQALPRSFIAVMLYIPIGLIVASSLIKYNDNTSHVPYTSIFVILLMISLAFPLIAYVLSMTFDKLDNFRPWVIVRNWTMLLVISLIAFVFALYLIGLLPFFIAYIFGLGLYLATLVIDIRLAWHIAGFDWIGAVFAGILISVTTMMVLLMGISQAII